MKQKILAFGLSAALCITLLCGCGQTGAASSASGKASSSPTAQVSAKVGSSVTELYQSQPLMMEMLVNEDCVISEKNDVLTISTKDAFAFIQVSFVPGIQNLTSTAALIPEILKSTYGAAAEKVTEGNLFGARANRCNYSYTDQSGKQAAGIFAASIVNQSLYLMNASFMEGCTDADAKLIADVLSTMNVLQPQTVDTTAKKATYQSRYPDAKPAKAAQTNYVPVTEWVYLPYYYYAWSADDDWDVYDSSYYEPDWDYYSDGDWWSWAWDSYDDWGFYDEYGDWYAEDFYDSYDDYYADYDPWSDPGDGNDEWSDPGDSEWLDPGDEELADYDAQSDPGDGNDQWSDPGDMSDSGDTW